MDTQQATQKTWTKVSSRQSDVVLLARPLAKDWLGASATVVTVDLVGEVRDAFEDLLGEPAYEGVNAPTASLRALLGQWDSGLISVDPTLGIGKAGWKGAKGTRAMARFIAPSEDIDMFRKGLAFEFQRWFVDRVVPKADRESQAIGRLYKLLTEPGYENYFKGAKAELPRRIDGRLDFELVSCELVRALEGLQPYADFSRLYRLVTPNAYRDGHRLITQPSLVNNRWVSVRVRVVVGVMPFSQAPYVRFVAEKVNWAARPPTQTSNRPRTAEAVLITSVEVSQGVKTTGGFVTLPLERHFDPATNERSYRFSQTAESLLMSADAQRGPLKDLIQNQFNEREHWIGLPMTTRLYRSMPSRTVYESDEAQMLEQCAQACSGMLDTEFLFRALKARSLRKPGAHASIKIGDVEGDGEGDGSTREEDRRMRTLMYQGALALRHGDRPVHLRVFCGGAREQELLGRAVEALFGHAVQSSFEVIPRNTHGLSKNLPAAKLITDRFKLRVEAWSDAAAKLTQLAGPKVALVCAPDTYEGRQTEEPINRLAGIRAFCAAGVDVHHLLPIAGEKPEDELQFLQRAQSALLDVLFAHTGSVLPVTSSYPNAPTHAYGIQKITTAGQAKKGERPKSFLALSRLELATGALYIRYAVPKGNGLEESPWEPFNEGLRRITDPAFYSDAPRGKQKDLVDELAPQWTVDTFRQINDAPTRSLVMLCWDTMSSALPFRDLDLSPGRKPELTGRPLAAAFPKLSIVRVRGNEFTPSARTRMRVRFQRVRGEAGRDEIEVDHDDYYTSTKTVLDLTTPQHPTGVGHFIVSMSYGGNAAQPRGLSAFQQVQRFAEVKPEGSKDPSATRQYRRAPRLPGSKDVPIPSATDIVVLSTPVDFLPELVAQMVVGLREGYVHYRSWTRLPVPLFFEKKIRDHVMRLDLEEEDTVSAIVQPDDGPIAGAGSVESTDDGVDELDADLADLVRQPAKMEAASVTSASMSAHSTDPGQLNDSPVETQPRISTQDAPSNAPAALQKDDVEWAEIRAAFTRLSALTEVKAASWGTGTLTQRIKDILNGRWDVRVPLPAFATREKLFGPEMPPSRKLRRLIVSKLQSERVTAADIETPNWFDWLHQKLEVPISGPALIKLMGTLGIPYGFNGGEFAHDMVEEAKKGKPDNQGPPYLTKEGDRFDEARAWLVLWFALYPARSLGTLLSKLEVRSGPMLDEALDYLRRTVAAVDRIKATPAGATPVIHLPAGSLISSEPAGVLAAAAVAAQLDESSADTGLPVLQRAAAYRLNEQAIARLQARVREIASMQPEQVAELHAALNREITQLQAGVPMFWSTFEIVLTTLADLAAAHRGIEEARAREEELARESERKAELERQREEDDRRRLEEEQLREEVERQREQENQRSRQRAQNLDRLQGYVRRLNDSIEQGRHELPSYRSAVGDSDDDRLGEDFESQFQSLEGLWASMEGARAKVEETSGRSRRERAEADGTLADAEEAFLGVATSNHPLITPVSDADAPVPTKSVAPAVTAKSVRDELPQPVPTGTDNTPEPVATGVGETSSPVFDVPAAPLHAQLPVAEAAGFPAEEVEEEAAMDEERFAQCLGTLATLVIKRRYGLAASHSTALMVGANDREYTEHHDLLVKLFDTMDTVVCGPRIDIAADPIWADVLADPPARELCSNEGLAMAALAATLVPMCFSGDSAQRSQLLQSLQGLLQHVPSLGHLIEMLAQFDQGMSALTLDECRGLNLGAAVRGQDLKKQMEARAARWMEGREISVSFSHRGSQGVNAYLFSPKAPYGQALVAVAAGDQRLVQKIWSDRLEKFRDGTEIDAAQANLRERRRIEGHFRQQIIGNIAITRRFIQEYLDLLKPQAFSGNPQGRRATFVRQLHDAIQQALKAVKAISHVALLDGIFRQCLDQALASLDRCYTAEPAPHCAPKLEQRLLVCQHLDNSLLPAVHGDRPLADWAETLEETTALAAEDFGDDSQGSGEAFKRLLLEAMNQHRGANRWYPASLIADRVLSLQEQGELRKLRNRRRDELRDEIARARAIVGQALSMAAIDPENAAAMETQLRYIEGRIEVIGTAEAKNTDAEVVDFAFASARIRNDVLRQLDLTLNKRAEQLLEDLAKLEEESDGPGMIADIQRVRSMLEISQAPSVLIVAADAVTRIQRREPVPASPQASLLEGLKEAMEEFESQLGSMCKSDQNRLTVLEKNLVQPAADTDPDWRRTMSPERASSAKTGVALWRKVFAANGVQAQQEALQLFLQWLGMPAPSPAVGGSVQQLARWDVSPLLGLRSGFLPPELGSDARTLAVIADRAPAFDQLSVLVAQISDNEPTFILTKRRLDWAARAKLMNQGKKLLIIDESLVLFATCRSESPLRAMLDVALGFYPASPYHDYGARPAPKEMFFGRLEEIRRLRDIPGAAILYGGRRLGKTSLLREVASQLEAQKIPGHYAIELSCNQQRSSPTPLTGIWLQIESALRDRGAIGGLSPLGSNAATISDHVEKGLTAGAAKDVYLLIDEIDFVESNDGGIEGGIRAMAHRLSTMIESLNNRGVRLRYCLAGLHDLARMSNEQNSILGKATTLSLEPYISKDNIAEGFKLVTVPMEALGYKWEKNANLPYRILTTCNYYPAFIQIYCGELLQHMLRLRENKIDHQAPVEIATRHLDEVEQSSSFLSQIRKGFAINLELDIRYRAIALVLAQRYYESCNAEATRDGVEVSDIRRECDFWAPRHFKGLGSGAFLSLLNEMQKLTILDYTGTGYRLRNPNIAMMIGNKSNVEDQLIGLGRDDVTKRRTNGDQLQRIGSDQAGSVEVFPLPNGLLRTMLIPIDHESARPPVPLLVGSKYSGMAQVAGHHDQVINLFEGTATFSVAKGRKIDARDIGRPNADKPTRQLWMVGESQWECINEADATKIRRRSDQLLQTRRRLVLEASAQQTWQFARQQAGELPIPPYFASTFEVIPVPQWSTDTLFYLGEAFIDEEQEACNKRIIEVSGGICDIARYLRSLDRSQIDHFERMVIDRFCTSNGQASFSTLLKQMGYGKVPDKDLVPLANLLGVLNGETANDDLLEACLDVAKTPGSEPRRSHHILAQWTGLIRVDAEGKWAIPGFVNELLKRQP